MKETDFVNPELVTDPGDSMFLYMHERDMPLMRIRATAELKILRRYLGRDTSYPRMACCWFGEVFAFGYNLVALHRMLRERVNASVLPEECEDVVRGIFEGASDPESYAYYRELCEILIGHEFGPELPDKPPKRSCCRCQYLAGIADVREISLQGHLAALRAENAAEGARQSAKAKLPRFGRAKRVAIYIARHIRADLAGLSGAARSATWADWLADARPGDAHDELHWSDDAEVEAFVRIDAKWQVVLDTGERIDVPHASLRRQVNFLVS